MEPAIEKIIERVPEWKGNNTKTSFLAGGLTNLNYKVEVGEKSFVLRIPGKNTELLGINRDCEYAATKAAANQGIAPEIMPIIKPEGYMITEFITGRAISGHEIRHNRNISRIATRIREFHSLPSIPWQFCPFRTIDDYDRLAHSHRVRFPENYPALKKGIDKIRQTLDQEPFEPCLCHNDLLNANFLDENGIIRILDWEYAGMGDACFDLANFAAHHEFSEEEEKYLLQSYFQEPATPARHRRLQLLKIVSDMREAMWAMVQLGISQLDVDYRDYAGKHFDRVEAGLKQHKLIQ